MLWLRCRWRPLRPNLHSRTGEELDRFRGLTDPDDRFIGALAADQAVISVVAGNIANANTPGYTTETVKWGSADTVTVGGQSVGA